MSLARSIRIIPVLLLALALAGCSALKLGYASLPQAAYWWLDGFADFDEPQAAQVRDAVAGLHAWHRRHELPRIADLLERVERMAAGEVSAQQACTVLADARDRLVALAEQGVPMAAPVALTLTPRQLRHIERKYRQRNEKYRREWIDPEPTQRQGKRFEQLLDRMEMLYGRLEAPQRAVLRDAVQRSVHDPERLLAEFRRRQQDTLQALRRATAPGATPEQAGAWLREVVQRVQDSPDPGYREWQQGLLEEGCRTFAAVHASTTPAQREHAARRLRGWQQDLRELAHAPRP
jgi:hypothetical protein